MPVVLSVYEVLITHILLHRFIQTVKFSLKSVNLCKFTAWCTDVLADKPHPQLDMKILSKKVRLIRRCLWYSLTYMELALAILGNAGPQLFLYRLAYMLSCIIFLVEILSRNLTCTCKWAMEWQRLFLECPGVYKDVRPSDRARKKMKNYVKIFGNIMWKKLTIMWKKCQIMQKFPKFQVFLQSTQFSIVFVVEFVRSLVTSITSEEENWTPKKQN